MNKFLDMNDNVYNEKKTYLGPYEYYPSDDEKETNIKAVNKFANKKFEAVMINDVVDTLPEDHYLYEALKQEVFENNNRLQKTGTTSTCFASTSAAGTSSSYSRTTSPDDNTTSSVSRTTSPYSTTSVVSPDGSESVNSDASMHVPINRNELAFIKNNFRQLLDNNRVINFGKSLLDNNTVVKNGKSSPATMRRKKRLNHKKQHKKKDDAVCSICKIRFSKDPLGGDWIQCIACNMWVHERCTNKQDNNRCIRCFNRKIKHLAKLLNNTT